MPKDFSNYIPLLDIDTAKFNPATWDALLEYFSRQHLGQLIARYLPPQNNAVFIPPKLYQEIDDTYHYIRNGELLWLTEQEITFHANQKEKTLYCSNNVSAAFNSNIPKHNSAVELIAYLEGMDRSHALDTIAQRLGFKKQHIFPDKTFRYDTGSYATKQLQPNLPFNILKYKQSCFEYYTGKFVNNSSGKPFGFISVFKNTAEVIVIPFKIKKISLHSSSYIFETGITNAMLDFYNRDDLKNKPEATIILTDNFFTACTLNDIFSEAGESNYLATSWYGGVNTYLRPDYSYLTGRNIILLLTPEGLNIVDHMNKECEKHSPTSLKLSLGFADIVTHIKKNPTNLNYDYLIKLIENTAPYKRLSNNNTNSNIQNYLTLEALSNHDSQPTNSPQMYWDKFIVPGEITLLYGPTDIGKTLFSYSLAAALSTGEEFYKLSVQHPRKILYIDGETTDDNARIYAKRISSYFKKSTTNLHIHLNKFCDKKYFFNDEEEYPSYTTEFNEFDVIILDNLLSLAAETARAPKKWDHFREWLSSLSAAIVILHHESDEAKIIGPSIIKNLIPTQIHLSIPKMPPPSNGAFFEIEFEKNKTYPQLKGTAHAMHLALGENTGWTTTSLSTEVSQVSSEASPSRSLIPADLSAHAKKIIDNAIDLKRPFTRAEAEDWIGRKDGAARKYLTELIEAKLLSKLGQGKATRYTLTSSIFSSDSI